MDDDAILRSGWAAFCDSLKASGAAALDRASGFDPADRVAALRQVGRNIALSFEFELENADPLHPDLRHYFDPLRKQGGDNPDALYLGAPINGSDYYQITGQCGTADYLAITTVKRGGTPFGGGVAGALFGDEMVIDDDGEFVIDIGPERRGRNWIRTTPECFRVTIRQFFSDWAQETPMRPVIERVGDEGKRQIPAADMFVEGLERSAGWLDSSLAYWADMLARWKKTPEIFLGYGELVSGNIDATPGGEPLIAYWTLDPDEVLLIRIDPPVARYWSLELGNAWWESMDYRDRLASFNGRHAVVEEDGKLMFVLSHVDPQVPNWLDASGHREGYVTFRWIGVDAAPRPYMQRMKVDALASLTGGTATISRDDRAAQLRARRSGLTRRSAW